MRRFPSIVVVVVLFVIIENDDSLIMISILRNSCSSVGMFRNPLLCSSRTCTHSRIKVGECNGGLHSPCVCGGLYASSKEVCTAFIADDDDMVHFLSTHAH